MLVGGGHLVTKRLIGAPLPLVPRTAAAATAVATAAGGCRRLVGEVCEDVLPGLNLLEHLRPGMGSRGAALRGKRLGGDWTA